MDNGRAITVTPEDLRVTAKDLSEISNELKECFNKITASIGVIRENWTDENGREFSERYETEVKPKLSAYYDSIMTHSNFISNADKVYRDKISSIHYSVN